MKHLLILIALAASAQQIKINPITGLPDLVGSSGGGGATSVTAGATGAMVITPTTGAVVVDVDTAYVPNKAGAETIIGDWTFYDSTAVTGSTTLTVRAGAGQSTNPLTLWKDASNNSTLAVRDNGVTTFIGNETFVTRSVQYGTDRLGMLVPAAASGSFLLTLDADGIIRWDSATGSGTKDTGFARNAAGIVEVNNGTAGTLRDLTVRNLIPTGTVSGIKRSFGGTFASSDGVTALTAGATTYFTVPYACTIAAWNIVANAGTATVDIWKVATGTAIPTAANTITASATPALSSGTAAHSTTLTGWTTAVAANDIIGVNLEVVTTATYVNLTVECVQ